MTQASGDFELTMDELRTVARFAAESAQQLLSAFEAEAPDDRRPRAALDAAWAFADGDPRTNLQRVTALDAHRAAKENGSEIGQLAARACGDAAAAAYLHPIARATQVGHILRAAACAARVAELDADGDEAAAAQSIKSTCDRATSVLLDVLGWYPAAPVGKSRLAQIMSTLDVSLRRREP
ncbi:putative immunity protein [Rhodococcus sp. NPDC056743]|uniref:putative immunity protein n=1 Tax=Rhodococcus sp. NPDC056743 TaxID=3345934 RepID=UPI00366D4C7E